MQKVSGFWHSSKPLRIASGGGVIYRAVTYGRQKHSSQQGRAERIALETPIDSGVRMHSTYLAVISCIRKWWNWKSKFRMRQDLRKEPRGLLTFK